MELLRAIFEGKPADDTILIWTLQGKAKISRHVTDLSTVDPAKLQSADTYFGCAARYAGLGLTAGQRGGNQHCSGIGAVWLDIDIAGPAHKKANLPAAQEEATALLDSCFPRLAPSFLIHSGHGLQAYYLLDSWLPVTDANRDEVSLILWKVNAIWRTHCLAAGFDADSVCDLSRVMRLPGTRNHKLPESPESVTSVHAQQDHRFSWETIRTAAESGTIHPSFTPTPSLHAPKQGKSATQTAQNRDPGTPATSCKYDADKWDALQRADHRVKETFEHNRPDLKDQSGSSFDMSMCQFTIRAGWSDAEVAAIIQEMRDKHHDKDKDSGYIPRTISKVKLEVQQSGFVPPSEDTETTLAQLEEQIGIPIIGLVRYDSDPPAYVIELRPDTRINLGNVEGLTDQKKFRNAITAGANLLPRKIDAKFWDDKVRALLSCVRHDTAGYETTERGQASEWIEEYLSQSTIHEIRADAITAGEPWTEPSGAVFLTATALRTWISVHLGDKMNARQLGLALRSVGCEPVTVAHEQDGKKTTRYAWKVIKEKRPECQS